MTVFHLKKIIPLILIILFSCDENSTTEVPIRDSAAKVKMKPGSDSVSSTPKRNHLGVMFHHFEPFEIVSFHRGVTLEYTGPDDTSECKKWKIKKEDLPVIFKNSEPITGTTWDLAFAFTTCVVDGQVKQRGQLFDYSINAASWFSITCRDTGLLFGDYNKRDRKFFLDSVERH
jgi:hypothetical protein